MERQRDTDWVEKEREAAISLQRARREGFNHIQNSTPGPSSSVNARTEPDVEMEGDVNYTVGGREKDREAEKERSNRSNNKGKSKDVPVDNKKEQPMPSHLRNRHTPKPKSTGRPAQAGSWNDIKSRKKNASTKSRTFLHAQVASPFAIFRSCSRNAQVDVDDNGTEDDEDKVMENKRRKPG